MSDRVISIENVGKRYVLGHQRARSGGLRHVLESALRSPLSLARSLRDHPDAVVGRRVLDLATGSGIVAIVAAAAGAARVVATDIDPFAHAATRLNAKANGVHLTVQQQNRESSIDHALGRRGERVVLGWRRDHVVRLGGASEQVSGDNAEERP